MGYCTHFEVKYETNQVPDGIDKISVLRYLEEEFLGGYRFNSIGVRDGYCVAELIEATWYDWVKNMADFSTIFPEVLFQVDGEGEDSGDIWRAYVRNGKSYTEHATIKFEEFDEDRLT